MKTTASFRLSKYSKSLVAAGRFKTEDQRSHFRKMMIEAELAASQRPKSQKTRDVNNMPIMAAS